MITVWLPAAGMVEMMGGLPDGVRADVWTGGALPASALEVEVVCPPFDVEPSRLAVLSQLPRLRLVQLESVGADWVLPHVPAGVTLCNARGAYDTAVSEWVIATALTHLRQLPGFAAAQAAGSWQPAETGSLEGATVLIVGYGSIGAVLARLLRAFGATPVAVASRPRDGVHGTDELPSLVPAADVIVLLTPQTPKTTGLIDASLLALMRDGALLINAGRGAVVDTAALLVELRSGRLRAALDVTDPEPLPVDHPLWTAPGLVLTPHVAGSNGQPMRKAMQLLHAQLVRYVDGAELLNVVGPDGY